MRFENKPLLQDDPRFFQDITSTAVEVGLKCAWQRLRPRRSNAPDTRLAGLAKDCSDANHLISEGSAMTSTDHQMMRRALRLRSALAKVAAIARAPRSGPKVRKRNLVSKRSVTYENHSSIPSYSTCDDPFRECRTAGANRCDRLEQYRLADHHYECEGAFHRFGGLVRLCATGCL